MTKKIYTRNDLETVLSLLNEQEKNVNVNISLAKKIIEKTILDSEKLSLFCSKTIDVLKDVEFKHAEYEDIKRFVYREFEDIERGDERRKEKFNIYGLKKIVSLCEIYTQRYNIHIPDFQSDIFIYRVPNQREFDIAKQKFHEVLLYLKGDDVEEPENVTFCVRGTRKFIDMTVNELNNRAWLGFDFRNSEC
ncbi:hypothetical protein [Psychroflexus planctonicus]|uniref:Uncharacterized protein n=1 Tax=Psychroflexus planctonicus TaxID=1526575 RepID=A0ABQ1SCK6_9FLAO|nr:hypothetical protein [Psychroflexus planctonicus]GGE27523.1 hypothetical protein GCM10010832_05260 [Psychroflexus planctonicus]